jgi:hypothetical protein
MMEKEDLNEFARSLIKYVRDAAVGSMYVQLHAGNLGSPIVKRWHDMKFQGNIDKMCEMIISDTLDDTIFNLLEAIDSNNMDFSFTTKAGKMINLNEEGYGELGGSYMGEWRSELSNEPCFNNIKK